MPYGRGYAQLRPGTKNPMREAGRGPMSARPKRLTTSRMKLKSRRSGR